MTSRLHALCFDANDPVLVGKFWAGLLGWDLREVGEAVELLPGNDTGFRLRFLPTETTKTLQNLIHFDLTSRSMDEQDDTVMRALDLGGRYVDIGQSPEEDHYVMGDPEGNEFCVIEPGNKFLAGCGFIGAVNCDGSPEVGYFWSRALRWPLVWDQDQETAIQSPAGGSKVTWSGPPLMPRPVKVRQHFDIAPVDGDLEREVAVLTGLGATRRDTGQGDVSCVVMADPDGNEFCAVGTS